MSAQSNINAGGQLTQQIKGLRSLGDMPASISVTEFHTATNKLVVNYLGGEAVIRYMKGDAHDNTPVEFIRGKVETDKPYTVESLDVIEDGVTVHIGYVGMGYGYFYAPEDELDFEIVQKSKPEIAKYMLKQTREWRDDYIEARRLAKEVLGLTNLGRTLEEFIAVMPVFEIDENEVYTASFPIIRPTGVYTFSAEGVVRDECVVNYSLNFHGHRFSEIDGQPVLVNDELGIAAELFEFVSVDSKSESSPVFGYPNFYDPKGGIHGNEFIHRTPDLVADQN